MICIKGNPLVFIQYICLNNQPELKLGNRRSSASKMVTNEMKNVKSTNRVVHNVTKELTWSDDKLPHPSKLPFYRHATWIKEKEKKKSSFVVICHKMAEEQDSFIKCHHASGSVVSIALFNEAQLDDIKKFCWNDDYPCNALGIGTTFQFGYFYVVTTSYRHPFQQNKEGTYPTLLRGPMMATHRLQKQN